MDVYSDFPEEGEFEPGHVFTKALGQGYQGLMLSLGHLRPVWSARRLHLSETLEDHRGLRAPILTGQYDLIRRHLEDSRRLCEEIAWMGAEGFKDLVVTVTQGARSHQIEDQELLLVMKAVKEACETADQNQVRLSIRLCPRHVVDSLPTAFRFTKEIRHHNLGIWFDVAGMAQDGQLDPALGVRSLAAQLHGVEVSPSLPDAENFLVWLKQAPAPPRPWYLVIKDGQGDGLPLAAKIFPPVKSGKKPEDEKRERRGESRRQQRDIFPF